MYFRMIYDEQLAQAAYLIGCERTGEAILVDPERDIERYVVMAKQRGLKITAVAETHIHADFLSGARQFAEDYDAHLYLSGEGGDDWSYGWLDKKKSGGSYRYTLLKDGDTFAIGNIHFKVVHTPGHTPEHISFLVTDKGGKADEPLGILTGDFVFVGDVGRPDLLEVAAGIKDQREPSARLLAESASAFVKLPDFVQVWPAHGAGSACGKELGAVPQSTVGYEKRFNPALTKVSDKESFVDYVLDSQPEPPLYFGRMKIQNRDGVPLLDKLPIPEQPLSVSQFREINADNLVVVDSRSWDAYKTAHLKGALYVKLGASYPAVTGSYIEANQPMVLIVKDREELQSAVENLIRIGLDKVIGYLEADAIEQFSESELSSSREISATEYLAMRGSADLEVLDVRRAAEYDESHLEEAQNIAHLNLPKYLERLPKNKELIVHCRSGSRSAMACAYLEREGFTTANLAGGWLALKEIL